MSNTTPTPTDDEEPPTNSPETNVLYRTGPSLRPAVVKLGAALFVGVVVVGYVLANPQFLGSRQNSEIASYVVALLAVLLLARYAIRVYLLNRYEYTVTERGVRWEYSLFHKTRSRELPFAKIRGHELRQDRIQALLGFGTVAFLSGGTNQSLGFVRLENVADPDKVRRLVREQLAD